MTERNEAFAEVRAVGGESGAGRVMEWRHRSSSESGPNRTGHRPAPGQSQVRELRGGLPRRSGRAEATVEQQARGSWLAI